jgi:hypothetical protein
MGIEIAMKRQDERGIFGNAQHVRIDVDALRAQFPDFGNEMMRIDNDAVADDAQLAAHKARWQQRKLVADAVDDQRMTCIMTALVAHDDIARSDSQSTILPLPSSPHCDPTTTTFAIEETPWLLFENPRIEAARSSPAEATGC